MGSLPAWGRRAAAGALIAAVVGQIDRVSAIEPPAALPITPVMSAAVSAPVMTAPPSTPSTASTTSMSSAQPVTIRQELPANIVQGQPFKADVFVTNTTSRLVEDVELTGTFSRSHTMTQAEPPVETKAFGKEGSSWSLGKLAAGETRKVKIHFVPSEAPLEGDNRPEFRSDFRVTYRNLGTDTKAVKIQRARLDLSVTAPQVVVVGQPVTVQVALKNDGDAEARGVMVRSLLPEGLTHPSGADLEAEVKVVPAGYSEAVPLVLTPTKAGPVKTTFKISAPGMATVERELNLVAWEAKIDVQVNGPKHLPHNWPGTYEVTVKNAGDRTTPGVQLEVAVPPGFDDLRATQGARFDPNARKLIWAIGELKPDETKTMVWLGVATRTGEQPLTASAMLAGTPLKKTEWKTMVQASNGEMK